MKCNLIEIKYKTTKENVEKNWQTIFVAHQGVNIDKKI